MSSRDLIAGSSKNLKILFFIFSY
ncbi:MAG: palindromic element RPE4 domain-containing protein [Rickettsia endosymbiont of Pentastiridius leporinus]